MTSISRQLNWAHAWLKAAFNNWWISHAALVYFIANKKLINLEVAGRRRFGVQL
jgi:hypothetical protein